MNILVVTFSNILVIADIPDAALIMKSYLVFYFLVVR